MTLRRGLYSWLVDNKKHGAYNSGVFNGMYQMGHLTGRSRQGIRKTHYANGFFIGHQIIVKKGFGPVWKTFSRPLTASGISYISGIA